MIYLSSLYSLRACGFIWAAVGFSLLRKGLNLTFDLTHYPINSFSLLNWLYKVSGSSERACILLVVLAVVLGLAKAKMVLTKAATRNAMRLQTQNQVAFYHIFDTKLWIVIALMMGLAIALTKTGLAQDWRAFIDIAVGVALIVGASCYFKFSRQQALSNQP